MTRVKGIPVKLECLYSCRVFESEVSGEIE